MQDVVRKHVAFRNHVVPALRPSCGVIPNTERFMREGFDAVAHCVIPSFTCPNNMSIATGSPPKVHGISGNFYLDPATGEEVVMTGPELVRSRTVFDVMAAAGAHVVVITAKDLTVEDRRRLNGCVEKILHKGAYDRENLLDQIRDLVRTCIERNRSGGGDRGNGEDSAG